MKKPMKTEKPARKETPEAPKREAKKAAPKAPGGNLGKFLHPKKSKK